MRKRIFLLAVTLLLFTAAPSYAAGPETAAATKNTGSPYFVMVNRRAAAVTVYGLDDAGFYSIPVRAMVCSTGRAGFDTPPGAFTVSNRAAWMYMVDGSYGQYATRFNGAILFHSVCYNRRDPSTLMTYEYNMLGGYASRGCVRLQTADAKWVFDNLPAGTKVVVYDADSPGPLGKPDTLVTRISDTQNNGWDPTDPRPENPWRSVLGDKAGTSSAYLGMPFKDVRAVDPFYSQVLAVYRAGLMAGTDGTHFSPQKYLTYAQAQILARNVGNKVHSAANSDASQPSFPGSTIALPLPEGAAPQDPVPRSVFALYLWAAKNQTPSGPADPYDCTGSGAIKADLATLLAGLPVSAPLTRAEAAAMLSGSAAL